MKSFFWFKEKISDTEVFLPAGNRAARFGDGFFESIRVWKGTPLFLEQHLCRFKTACEILSLEKPDSAYLNKAIESIINSSGIKSGRLRIDYFRKGNGVYLPETNQGELLISLQELNESLYSANPVTAVVVETVRRSLGVLSEIKTQSAGALVLAALEAKQKGADVGVLLNEKGFVADCTGYNLFGIKGDRLFTPEVSSGALPGIMRGLILNRVAAEAGFSVEQKQMPLEELFYCEEIFLTNSVKGVVTVTELNGQKFTHIKATRLMALVKRVAENL